MYNKSKKVIIICIFITLLLGIGIGVSASTLLYSKDVTYDNSSSGMSAITVQAALDELYGKASSAPSCDSNGVCTVTCPNGTYYHATSTGYWCGLTAGEQLLAKVNVITSGDGLYADSTESGRYVYKGATPNNYIIFSGSTWRILAVETDGTLKLMKNDSIGDIAYSTNSSGAWSSATLNTYLNGTYYNTLDSTYIQNHSFNVGSVSTSSSSLTTTVNEEKAITWTGNIALANVSDVIKSNTNTSSCGSINSIQSNYSICANSSFIPAMASTTTYGLAWLVSFATGDTSRAWDASSSGNVGRDYVGGNSDGVLPVFYLSSNITLSGSGTSTDPYQITG